ncbi:MAG: hypothetical protein IKG87_03845 [Clostridia bacterium]|nr:hypothetical protein [Clostridia bacterium]
MSISARRAGRPAGSRRRPDPPCGARRIVRAYADPPILRPLQKSRNAFICHRQRHCAIPRCGAKMKNGRYEASWVDEAEALSAILDDDW